MFTGIVDHIGRIESAGRRIVISCRWNDLSVGESVAVDGVCLTVVGIRDSALGIREENTNPQSPMPNASFFADVSDETVSRTAGWEQGRHVNLERALKMGDALSGHLVTGHVDGVAKLVEIKPADDSEIWCLETSPALSRFIAEKGSVTLDGVSLTVNRVDGNRFWVNIIPHTRQVTTFSERKPGDHLNLEVDLIARYVERLVA